MSPGTPTISFSAVLLGNSGRDQISIENTTAPAITSTMCTLSSGSISHAPTQITEILGASHVTSGQQTMLALLEKHNMVPFEHMNQLYFIRSEQAEVLKGIRGTIQLLNVKNGNVTELVTSADTVRGLEKLTHLEWLSVDNIGELDISDLWGIRTLSARSATKILLPTTISRLETLAAPQLTTGIPLDKFQNISKLFIESVGFVETWEIENGGEWVLQNRGAYEYIGGEVRKIPTE